MGESQETAAPAVAAPEVDSKEQAEGLEKLEQLEVEEDPRSLIERLERRHVKLEKALAETKRKLAAAHRSRSERERKPSLVELNKAAAAVGQEETQQRLEIQGMLKRMGAGKTQPPKRPPMFKATD